MPASTARITPTLSRFATWSIANPGLSSIEAVFTASQTRLSLLCRRPDHSGQHVFAKTFEEQQQNVQKYQQGREFNTDFAKSCYKICCKNNFRPFVLRVGEEVFRRADFNESRPHP